MKLFNKYIVGALLMGSTAMSFQSCSLDEYNPSNSGADATFQTPAGMENLVNQMYYFFRAKYFGREDPCLLLEGSTDIWQNMATNYEYGMQLTRAVNLQGDRGQVGGIWDRLYDDVNNANAIINRLPNCKGITEAQANDFEGEARFIRAYCYWWLCEFFGDVELRLEETQTAKFTAERTDLVKIYDEVIIPDLKIAAAKLPVQPYNGNVGRATKKAAQAMLARVLLTRASYGDESKFCLEAYNEAKKMLVSEASLKSEYGVEMYKTYDDIWKVANNKGNTEYLWVNSFSSVSSNNADSKPNRLHMYYTPKLVGRPIIGDDPSWDAPKESNLLCPTYYFMSLWKDWDARYEADFQEKFYNKSGAVYKWEDNEEEADKYEQPAELKEARTRKLALALYFTKNHLSPAEEVEYAENGTVTIDIDKLYKTESVNQYGGARLRNCNVNYGEKEVNEYVASSFPRFRKFRVVEETDDEGEAVGLTLLAAPNGQFGYADASIMRFAEVPLIAAECAVRLNDKGEAVNIIKQWIRTQRVVAPGHTLAEAQADVTEANMSVEWLLEERARELCGEYLRWFDLKRIYAPQGKFAEIINGRSPSMAEGTDKGNARKEYNKYWPIPNTFRDKLESTETWQNYGFDGYDGYTGWGGNK